MIVYSPKKVSSYIINKILYLNFTKNYKLLINTDKNSKYVIQKSYYDSSD